jgi:hypothetical protein
MILHGRLDMWTAWWRVISKTFAYHDNSAAHLCSGVCTLSSAAASDRDSLTYNDFDPPDIEYFARGTPGVPESDMDMAVASVAGMSPNAPLGELHIDQRLRLISSRASRQRSVL